MLYLSFAVLGAALLCFAVLGLRARRADGPLDDYVTARNSQTASILATDRWQAWLLIALLILVAGVAFHRLPEMPVDATLPSIPVGSALIVWGDGVWQDS